MAARRSFRKVFLLTFALALAALPGTAQGAAYLRIENPVGTNAVPGESDAPGHQNEIVVESFSLSVNEGKPTANTPSGAGRGRPVFSELAIEKNIDRASPALLTSVATGRHYPKAFLAVTKNGEEPNEYFSYCLTDVVVTKLATSYDRGETTENIALSYSTIVETYTGIDPNTGSPAAWSAGFDLRRNMAGATCPSPPPPPDNS